MKILLASAHPFIPQIAGGAQSSTHELARALIVRGHEVSVLSGLTGSGWIGMRGRLELKLGRRRIVTDRTLGYPVHRGWFPKDGVDDLVERDRPDLVFLQSGKPVPIAKAFLDRGIPAVLYLRNVEFDDLGGDLASLGPVEAIANSAFTAKRFKTAFGLDCTVILPLLDPVRYRTKPRRRTVTFINPHPLKGLDVALGLARACPDIPFEFVEAWTLEPEGRAALLAEIRQLPNVALRLRTRDMREVYGEAKLVLAPSRWEEGFGRIAAEAHYSGIPVIATRVGGLPEAVGPGGLLIDPDAPLEEWVEAVRSLWTDEERYRSLCTAAETYSRRPELDARNQIDAILEVLARARRNFEARTA